MSTYTATTVPTQFVEANGIRFAYRRWGKRSGLPLVFNQHFTGNLDNWDPAVLNGFAKEREVIIFNNAGVASPTGAVPTTFAGMAKDAEAFIDGLGSRHSHHRQRPCLRHMEPGPNCWPCFRWCCLREIH